MSDVLTSPSSRRAWIEILPYLPHLMQEIVALLAEGVDRNFGPAPTDTDPGWSPSSRRAWIEMGMRWYK